MTDYQIQPNTRHCAATGRELRAGEKFYSVLSQEGGKLVRRDYAAEAWQGAASAADEAAAELAESQEHLEEAAEAATTALQEASAARATYEALRATAGAAVDELFRQLGDIKVDLARREEAEKAARRVEQRALVERGRQQVTAFGSPQRMAADYLAIFEEVVAARIGSGAAAVSGRPESASATPKAPR